MIQINEMFYSIQGEGQRAGRPAVFIRTGLCNFRCPGFKVKYTDPKTGEKKYGCDSFYAVDPAFKKEWSAYTDYKSFVQDINNIIPDFGNHSITKPDIILTGGEPLLYWDDEIYQRTIAYYISRGFSVTIETNAALDINFTREYQKKIIFSQSVKLAISGEPEHKRINTNTLTKIAENTNSFLKFVVSKDTWEQDIIEIKNILEEIPVYVDVWLMPLGDTNKTLEKNALFTAEQAMKLGFNYTDRTHIRLWDNKPGV